VTEKLLQRYLKVKALADAGSEGEKVAAQNVLAKMLEQNPGIEEAAADLWKREAAARGPTRTDATPVNHRGRWPFRPGNWEEIFRYAAGVYQTVQEVVEDVTDAAYGQTLAEEGVEFRGGRRRDHLYIRAKFPFDVAEGARGMNAVQREAFRQALHAKFDVYIDSLLGE
jgi:hypothetical protein